MITMADKKNTIKLRVGEIPPYAQEDIGSGLVRIDSQVMQKLGIREGQAIEISCVFPSSDVLVTIIAL